jgi:hypothetical protein
MHYLCKEMFILVALGDRITEGATEAAQHAGVEEKRLKVSWLGTEDFADEIVDDRLVTASEGLQDAPELLLGHLSLKEEREKVQSGDPAFQQRLA